MRETRVNEYDMVDRERALTRIIRQAETDMQYVPPSWALLASSYLRTLVLSRGPVKTGPAGGTRGRASLKPTSEVR